MRALWLLVLMLACEQGAVGRGYRGEPLFTVAGQLVTNGQAPQSPIRIAVAWYPDVESSTAPKALVTQPVEYQGSFPLNYSFSFFTVPEQSVFKEYKEGERVVRAAFAVVIAYEDVNGNGTLDTIPPGGKPVDRVLGSSIGDRYNGRPAAQPVWIAYVDGEPPQSWVGYRPGYNLVSGSATLAPASPIAIPMTASNEMNFLVCEEFISGSAYGYELPCNLAPTEGVRVIGNVYLFNSQPGVSLRITDGYQPLSSVLVDVNDAGVAFDRETGFYRGTVPVNVGGNVVRVRAPGRQPYVFQVEAPADFALLEPSGTSIFRTFTGMPVSVSWSRALGASFYQVTSNGLSPPVVLSDSVIVYETSQPAYRTQLKGFTQDDTSQVSVAAFAPKYLSFGPGGSLVNAYVSRAEYLDVKAVDVGLWLEGALSWTSFSGQMGGYVWVHAFDGVTAVTDALVTENGNPAPYDAAKQAYWNDLQGSAPKAVVLNVSRVGRMLKSFTVELPEDFTVTRPPPNHSRREPLALTWTSSAHARHYRVVVNKGSRTLFQTDVVDTQVTIPPLEYEGDVVLIVAAARPSASRHLIAYREMPFEITLTP